MISCVKKCSVVQKYQPCACPSVCVYVDVTEHFGEGIFSAVVSNIKKKIDARKTNLNFWNG